MNRPELILKLIEEYKKKIKLKEQTVKVKTFIVHIRIHVTYTLVLSE